MIADMNAKQIMATLALLGTSIGASACDGDKKATDKADAPAVKAHDVQEVKAASPAPTPEAKPVADAEQAPAHEAAKKGEGSCGEGSCGAKDAAA